MLRPALLSIVVVASSFAQELLPKPAVLHSADKWADFPSLCTAADGTPWVAYVQWDAEKDTLHLAKLTDGALSDTLTIGQPGIIHQPALAADGNGTLHVVWSQVNDKNLMDLKAARVRDGKLDGEITTLASSPNGANAFAKSGTDAFGNVWVVWQGNRGKLGDVFCRVFDAKKKEWSAEIVVADDAGGDWEPCVAFDGKGGAWVLYDSSLGNEFNIYATHIDAGLKAAKPRTLISTERYEGRVNAVGTPDGKGLWLACERGNQQWGLDMRAHGHPQGLNGRKDTVIAYWDFGSDKIEEIPSPDGLFTDLPGPKAAAPAAPRANNPKAKAKTEANAKKQAAQAKAKGKPAANEVAAVNLPHIMLDAAGRPWLTVRYFKAYAWRLALTRYDVATKQWTKPFAIPESVYSQDRQTSHALGKDGSLWIAWPSDGRTSKLQLNTGLHLAKVDTGLDLPLVAAPALKPREPFPEYINPVTPERDRDDRHTWTHDGVIYKLYWGDYHRHTDVSNCITANDGCIVEQFRYAWDMGKLDTLGTSDHTDIAKIYTPYEWWLNQKLVDVFYTPGFFMSMYAYEREQKWPYGHRNMVFAQRGGPIVYIQRKNYLASPWQKIFPLKEEGEPELHPSELWDVLTRYGKPVTAISHTGATGMGTDWNQIPPIDHRVENVIEIYQGARVSYEGLNAPQPTVGLRKGEEYNHASTVIGKPVVGEPIRSFTEKNNGVYQHALEIGHKLGVWANSDHISTHTSYGGVYVKDFTREGIVEGLNARRTIAATDKIFVEFTCNDKLLGTEIELTGKPVLKFSVDGTAPIKRVTLVRNEKNHQQWEPNSKTFEQTFTDESPDSGENRYYLRVEQNDGNMAWSSPVWVKIK
ncbi:hypothetical protein [Prosthecobacter sp.]|uniref:hypothetical protein n=1 Tax=Prosthecobacter sp. TaxID=1965333 RepID=UPI001D5C1A49|nr:hypothetical protein [Prosthecobacter sp.]MCB1276389.1 hypothetical protein [Prosthecobacter sp.]